MLIYVTLRCYVLCYVVLSYYVMLWYVMLIYVMLRYVMLSYVMLCYVMPSYMASVWDGPKFFQFILYETFLLFCLFVHGLSSILMAYIVTYKISAEGCSNIILLCSESERQNCTKSHQLP